ncbi:MAG: hypothetical protein JKY43_09830 [Phycisphaerales bacterium]|nr:hypothetical protein [Phycisphaerales bacterium]
MTGAINNLASSLAGVSASSNLASRKKIAEDTDKARRRGRVHDSYQAAVEHIEQIDAVRNLADADQEEANEDRQENQIKYTAKSGQGRQDDGKPRLDLNA